MNYSDLFWLNAFLSKHFPEKNRNIFLRGKKTAKFPVKDCGWPHTDEHVSQNDIYWNKSSEQDQFPHLFKHRIQALQGLSRSNSLKFKNPTRQSLRHRSRLITFTALLIVMMRTSSLYWTSQIPISKRERCKCVTTSQLCCCKDGRLCGLLPSLTLHSKTIYDVRWAT